MGNFISSVFPPLRPLLSSYDRSLQVSKSSLLIAPGLTSLSLSFPENPNLFPLFPIHLSIVSARLSSPIIRRLYYFFLAKHKSLFQLWLPFLLLLSICAMMMERWHHKLLAIVATSMYFCTHTTHDGEVSKGESSFVELKANSPLACAHSHRKPPTSAQYFVASSSSYLAWQ